jgi:flagellar L-ring protein precursor FlgH
MKKNSILLASTIILVSGCAVERKPVISNPAEDYAKQIKGSGAFAAATVNGVQRTGPFVPLGSTTFSDTQASIEIPNNIQNSRAQLRMVNDVQPTEAMDSISNTNDYRAYRQNASLTRDYQGPLDLGDPGVQASLWKESRSANDMLRDDRAWQAGDLITIRVNENDVGLRQARTDSKSESSLAASLENFFGLAEMFGDRNDGLADTENLIKGSTKEEFKGQGTTDRRSQLIARLSVMVAEVLPTGILRIEGKKIVTVNDEEQMMILSGLIRVRDINYSNEVDSSKVANMRIDYYGVGSLGDVQYPGWGTQLIRRIWPF